MDAHQRCSPYFVDGVAVVNCKEYRVVNETIWTDMVGMAKELKARCTSLVGSHSARVRVSHSRGRPKTGQKVTTVAKDKLEEALRQGRTVSSSDSETENPFSSSVHVLQCFTMSYNQVL